MTDDATIQRYIAYARTESAKGEKWMHITPRLALEVFEELLALRNKARAELPSRT